MFVVDLRKQALYQKCFDPDCRNYRGEEVALPIDCQPCFYEADSELIGLMEGLDLSSYHKTTAEASPWPQEVDSDPEEEQHFGSAAAAAKRRSSLSRPREASQSRSVSKSRRRSVSNSLPVSTPSSSQQNRRRSSDRLMQKLLSRSPSYGFDDELAGIMEQAARAC